MTRQFPNFIPVDLSPADVNIKKCQESPKTKALTKLFIEAYDYFKDNNIQLTANNFRACIESEGVQIHLAKNSFNSLSSQILCILKDKQYEKELRSGELSASIIRRRMLRDRQEKEDKIRRERKNIIPN
jgi:hypothetical protein